jgi:hypothetical protein
MHTIYKHTNVFVLVLYAKQQQKNPHAMLELKMSKNGFLRFGAATYIYHLEQVTYDRKKLTQTL